MAICDCSIVICSHYWFLGGARNFISINRLPPEVVKYFTDPNAIEPPDMQLLFPFVESALPLAYGVQLFHFKSILLDQKTKVDISLAVPFAGVTLSFSMFAVGLLLSSNPNAAGDLVQVPSMLFQGSLLLGLISRATLGYAAMHTATVWVHPIVIAGWCGLTMSAFNMLPAGCLDGGRAIQVSIMMIYAFELHEEMSRNNISSNSISIDGLGKRGLVVF